MTSKFEENEQELNAYIQEAAQEGLSSEEILEYFTCCFEISQATAYRWLRKLRESNVPIAKQLQKDTLEFKQDANKLIGQAINQLKDNNDPKALLEGLLHSVKLKRELSKL